MNIRPLSFVTIPNTLKKQPSSTCSFKSSDGDVNAPKDEIWERALEAYMKDFRTVTDEFLKTIQEISESDANERKAAYAEEHCVPVESLKTSDFYGPSTSHKIARYLDDDDDDRDLSDVSESDIHGIW